MTKDKEKRMIKKKNFHMPLRAKDEIRGGGDINKLSVCHTEPFNRINIFVAVLVLLTSKREQVKKGKSSP